MKALLIPLTLESPLLITHVGNGDENSSRSLPYIPGSALRGALVGRYVSSQTDLLKDETALRLFFSDQVTFLNAYPATDQNGLQRSLPTPASWRKEKGTKLEDKPDARDFALMVDEEFDEAIQIPFCSPELISSLIQLIKPDEELTTHISGEERGRVLAGNNTVFQYQALADGQIFTAVILTQNDEDSKTLKQLLEKDPTIYLGRSRSARYGRVRIGIIYEKNNWSEVTSNQPADKTIITLLSDALLRDANGQSTSDLDGWLTQHLNKGKNFKSEKRFIKPALVGGFNRKWGLPLPQAPALGMGSVFVYAVDHLTPAELVPLVESGIGDRRIEGFGRIAVNWQGADELRIEKYQLPEPKIFRKLTPSSQKIANEMAQRILRQRLDAHLSDLAQRYEISKGINNHQLARIRNQLRQVINSGGQNTQAIKKFLKELRRSAREQYERAKVKYEQEAVRLIVWLDERLDKKDVLSSFSSKRHPEVAGQKAELDDKLKTEYTLRLIEAVINRQMKENRE